MKKVAVLKYNAGNVRSLSFALGRLGVEANWTDDPDELRSAERVIIPGVGAAPPAMQYLKERSLDDVIRSLTQPVLGICLGLQLFCRHSSESQTTCLGIFPMDAKRFKTPKKIPHMGWNTLTKLKTDLFKGASEEEAVYFVHSYRAPVHPEITIAECTHGESFSAALAYKNFYATQFHPEKSGSIGARILENFLAL